jgi:hypothetical protein
MQYIGFRMRLLAFIFVAICSLALTGCFRTGCKDTVLQSIRSPDGQSTASVTVTDCGAAVHSFSYVSIQTGQVKLRDKGMLFGYQGNPQLTLSWKGPKELRIECNSGCTEAKIYREVVKEGQYKIEYFGFAP